jgi:hypothetical protein
MAFREVVIKTSAAYCNAEISLYVETKGMVNTVEKYSDAIYDFFLTLANPKKIFATCKESVRASLGYKCVPYKKKYTVVFIESEEQIIICEFLPSKLIHW